MKRCGVPNRWIAMGAVLLAVLTVAPAMAGEVLTRGADVWQTATGFSYSNFASEPIPAGFFCPASKAFAGVIQLDGKPLATSPPGALGRVDTIVRRLDDAVLDGNGQASTRIQLLALSLASVRPIDSGGCGLYNVAASLGSEQPVTTMRIMKTSSGGGTYAAPLELNVKLVFTPVSGRGEPRMLLHRVSLGPGSGAVWSYAKPTAARLGTVKVDTDGDGVPDTVLPGPSNFRAGVVPAGITPPANPSTQPRTVCHCSAGATDPNTSAAGCNYLHCILISD